MNYYSNCGGYYYEDKQRLVLRHLYFMRSIKRRQGQYVEHDHWD